MRCGLLQLVLLRHTYRYILPLLQYYDDVRPANEAVRGLSRPETRAGPCTTCTEKSRSGCCCDDVFSRAELLVHGTIIGK